MRTVSIFAFALSIAACANAAAPRPPASPANDHAAVDYRCRMNADCVVKDVGNCCGAYPACVNRASPTFPKQVKAECAKRGMLGTCGFPVITGCTCVDGRCSDVIGGAH